MWSSTRYFLRLFLLISKTMLFPPVASPGLHQSRVFFLTFINRWFFFLSWHHTLRFTICAVKFCGSWQMYSVMRAPIQRFTDWVHFPKNPLCSTHLILLPSPWPLATSDLFTVSVFAFSRISYNWNHYVPFSDWLLSLSNMYLKFIPAFLQLESSFLFITE